jgi:hypothetical protein
MTRIWRIKTIAVLSFGDKVLVVVAIAHGGDDEWNNRHAAGREIRVSSRYAGCPNGVTGPARILR